MYIYSNFILILFEGILPPLRGLIISEMRKMLYVRVTYIAVKLYKYHTVSAWVEKMRIIYIYVTRQTLIDSFFLFF